MKRLSRAAALAVLLLFSAFLLRAEKVSDLPAPTAYVSDFAGALSPATRQSVEDLCVQVDRQAHAQIAVVTIKTLDDDQTVDDFAVQLEEKWKVGAKGTDRGVLMVFVMKPVKGRIEVGYGLEGILNDAKVGDIGRAMAPYAQQGDYNQAIPLGVQRIAQVIATDAGVTLTQPVHQYHRQRQRSAPMSLGQVIVFGAIAVFVLILLASTGNLGILWFILGSLMGGGGGGGGGRDDDDRGGGGFGGFGGGGSGGGGASGDF